MMVSYAPNWSVIYYCKFTVVKLYSIGPLTQIFVHQYYYELWQNNTCFKMIPNQFLQGIFDWKTERNQSKLMQLSQTSHPILSPGLSGGEDLRQSGPSSKWTFVEVDLRRSGPLSKWTFVEADLRRSRPSSKRTFVEADLRRSGPSSSTFGRSYNYVKNMSRPKLGLSLGLSPLA